MTESANPYRISRLWAEFVDPATERAYRLHMQPLLARHLRVALWVWGCLLLAFGLQDLQALGMSDEFLILAGCRALQAALVFALALLLPRYPGLAASGYAVTALEITGLVLFLPIYIRISYSFHADKMNQVLTVAIVDANGAVQAETSLSIRAYAQLCMEAYEAYDPTLCAMLVAMLDYGALAQVYADTDADDLANRYVTAAQRKNLTDYPWPKS